MNISYLMCAIIAVSLNLHSPVYGFRNLLRGVRNQKSGINSRSTEGNQHQQEAYALVASTNEVDVNAYNRRMYEIYVSRRREFIRQQRRRLAFLNRFRCPQEIGGFECYSELMSLWARFL